MRKKILWLALCVLMLLSLFPISSAFAASPYDRIRVKLSIGTPTKFSFLVDGNYSVAGKALERQLYTVKVEGGQLKLYLGSSLVSGGSTIYLTQHQMTQAQRNENLNNSIWLANTSQGDRSYIGDMSFSIQGGVIQLVNNLGLDQYLYGVVPHEMSDSFPLEALKSQAVAARNYAVSKISGSGTYDLTDLSSVDQVYKGYDPTLTNAIAAVDATAGKVMTYGGSVITAYYSASNGGMTDIPYHRWGGGANWVYYDIQPDPFDIANPSSLYETLYFPAVNTEGNVTSGGNTGTMPSTAIATNYIKQAILDSGQLSAYSVTGINQFALTGINGLYAHTYDTFSGQNHSLMPFSGVNNCIDMVRATGSFSVTLLSSMNGAAAPAEKPTVPDEGTSLEEPVAPDEGTSPEEPVAPDERTSPEEPVAPDEGTSPEEPVAPDERTSPEEPSVPDEETSSEEPDTADEGARVILAGETDTQIADVPAGTVVSVTGVDFSLRTLNGSDGTSAYKAFQSTSLGVVVVEPVYSGSTLTGYNIAQRRYGHGIGLSQRGAQQRAKAVSEGGGGQTYEQILAFYYPSTAITSLNTTTPSQTVLASAGYTNATVVNTTSLNVRSGPGTNYGKVGTLPGGARVEAMEAGVASSWYMIDYGGTAAYVHKDYIKQDTKALLSTKFIRRNNLLYIGANTTCSTLVSSFAGYSGTITVRNASGTVISGSTKVGAGVTVTLMNGSTTLDQVTLYLKGDVNGDGAIGIADYTAIRLHILNTTPLNGFGVQMADVDGDGEVDIMDYTLIRLYLLGLWSIG